MDNNKTNDSVILDKATLEEVIHEAVKNVVEEQKAEEELLNQDEDVTIDDEDKSEDENISDGDIDINVADEVNEKVEDLIDISGEAELMGGIKVNVEKTDDGDYTINLKYNDDEKTEVLDKNDLLNSFCSVITGFISDMTIDEAVNQDESELDDANNKEEEFNLDDIEELEESKKLEESKNTIESSFNINAIREQYADKVNAIFEHGLEARDIAFAMVKDSIYANTIGELADKSNAKSELIANKKTELTNAKTNYVIARKMNKRMNDFYNVVLSSVQGIENDLSKGLISKNVAEKCLEKYNGIISKIVIAKKPETILAGIQQVNKVQNALVASKEMKNKKPVIAKSVKSVQPKKVESVKEDKFTFDDNDMEALLSNNQLNNKATRRKPLISKRNVMNRDGMNEGTLSQRYSGRSIVDEMTAEITRIAGI